MLTPLPAEKPVTPSGVICQYLLGRGVYRYQAGLVKLGVANRQQALLQVDVWALQGYSLTDPQASNRQKTKEAVVCPGP